MGALRVSRAVRVIVVALPVVLACSSAAASSREPSTPRAIALPDRPQAPVVSKGSTPAPPAPAPARTAGPAGAAGTARASSPARTAAAATTSPTSPTSPTPTATPTPTPAATPTPTPTEPQVPARFDLDGDGLDEIVASAFCGPMGDCVAIRYSRSGRMGYLDSPTGWGAFGSVLAAGDFNGDGYADLAVSGQGEIVAGVGDAGGPEGAVWVYFGGPNGLDANNPQYFNLDTPGIPYDMQPYDLFGSSLATGDLNGDGYADLAIGADGEQVGDATNAGVVVVLYGSPTGLTTNGAQALAKGSAGVPGTARANDEFGTAVAIGDVTGDGYADLAVSGGGMVVVLRGSAGGLTATGSSVVYGDQNTPVGNPGDPLAIADVNGDGHADVLATTSADFGALVYLPGTANGIGTAGARLINKETPGVPGETQGQVGDGGGDFFASSIATGDVTGDGLPDVVLGSVGTDVNGVIDAGAVYLIPGSKDGLTGAGSLEYWPGKPIGQGGTIRANPGDGLTTSSVVYYGHSVSALHLDPNRGLDILVSDETTIDGGLFERLTYVAVPTLRPRGMVSEQPDYLQPDGYTTGHSLGVDALGYPMLLHG